MTNTTTPPTTPQTITIPTLGHITLINHNANDLNVINAARASYNKTKTQIDPEDIHLINYLLKNRHGTPFEHNSYTYQIEAPIFIIREWQRHRIGHSYNEQSGRYTQLPNKTWQPTPNQITTQTGKPGHYTHQPAPPLLAETAATIIKKAHHDAHQTYQQLLNLGISKEQARTVLPLAQTTNLYWTTNARALMHFLTLRTHPTAQKQIQQYAHAAEQLATPHMPHTFHAYNQNGRQAP